MRIDSSGDVGIGGSPVTGAAGSTTTHIKGTSSGAYLRLTTDTAGHTASDGLDIILGGGTNPDAYIWNRENGPLKFGTNNTERMSIAAGGDVTVAGTITSNSDIRLKENVEVITDAVEKIKAIRGVTYTRNDLEDTTTRYAGVIAQEVEAVLPEVVLGDGDDIKSVAYGNLVSLLIEGMKEQQTQIDDLKSQLTTILSK
jgi:hypothetical protein